ncbi:hypothetical protein ABH924_000994 [Arthrobacter sp. GAS37]
MRTIVTLNHRPTEHGMLLSVYGHRRENHEHSYISEFGYRTWWLTGETCAPQTHGTDRVE